MYTHKHTLPHLLHTQMHARMCIKLEQAFCENIYALCDMPWHFLLSTTMLRKNAHLSLSCWPRYQGQLHTLQGPTQNETIGFCWIKIIKIFKMTIIHGPHPFWAWGPMRLQVFTRMQPPGSPRMNGLWPAIKNTVLEKLSLTDVRTEAHWSFVTRLR